MSTELHAHVHPDGQFHGQRPAAGAQHQQLHQLYEQFEFGVHVPSEALRVPDPVYVGHRLGRMACAGLRPSAGSVAVIVQRKAHAVHTSHSQQTGGRHDIRPDRAHRDLRQPARARLVRGEIEKGAARCGQLD